MANDRQVTERDFRKPEFFDADPKDYEFRSDGEIVRKDRWEKGIRRIADMLRLPREWEIPDVIEAVRSSDGAKAAAKIERLEGALHSAQWLLKGDLMGAVKSDEVEVANLITEVSEAVDAALADTEGGK